MPMNEKKWNQFWKRVVHAIQVAVTMDTAATVPYSLSPQILRKHCFQFFLGLTMVPKENKTNAYTKFGGGGGVKQYYGIFRSGLLVDHVAPPYKTL